MSKSSDFYPHDGFTTPSQWVAYVVKTLEERLNVNIESSYVRESSEPQKTYFTYHVGESNVLEHTGNDGRKLHEIELNFLVYVPIAVPDFDLEALDASTRIEREFLNDWLEVGQHAEETQVISNQPRKFDPQMGVFLRTVVVNQRIYMGKIDEPAMPLADIADHEWNIINHAKTD